MKYLPSYILTVLREKENEKIEGAMTLTSFKKFVSLHKTDINKSLANKKSIVKKIIKHQQVNEVMANDVDSYDHQRLQIEGAQIQI